MQRERRSTTLGALSAAVLFLATAPAAAQGLVSIGSGSYTSPSEGTTSRFSYYLTDRGNGAAQGYAIWLFPNSAIAVEVTSFGFLQPLPTSLSFAGPIVAVLGTPPSSNAVVGRTAYTAFNDNGHHAADETVGFDVAPLPSDPLVQFLVGQFPPLAGQIGDLTTIQQIAALGQFLARIGQLPPPPWTTLLRGDVWIR
jgi:hypothetical protein